MKQRFLQLTIIATGLILCCSTMQAQKQSDTARVQKKTDTIRAQKKFDFAFIGGPNYASDTKLGLGAVATGKYYTVRDSLTSPSNVAIFGNISTSGFFSLGIRGNNFFEEDRNRIDYELKFYSFPSNIWGFGYYNGDNDSNESSYKRIQVSFKGDFMHELAPNLFAGPHLEYDFIRGSNYKDSTFIIGLRNITRSFGYGAAICYDTRDYIPNPYCGTYVKLSQINYVEPGQKPYFKSILNADYYKTVWKGGVIALDYYQEFSYGKTPWTMLALMGGSYRMRGYYEGRYRDKNLVCFQAELRQNIWRRHGLTFWTGAGNIWGIDKFQWGHTLPNVGIGYRFRIKNRTNVRLDYGLGKHWQSGITFQIDEAF
ncbi:MAG: hypothetical protein LKM37_05490 [Bacteroidales bacterium]|jgi:outer membrane protein assembly factor BamA|nr:hypothetical protein [Bacteroidales bacterium]MCI1733958.1 hypothetical protein [Bacteroidales bacterium]